MPDDKFCATMDDMIDGTTSLAAKLNWLRAGVLGANDGVVSTAGIVMGVAGATANTSALLIAGLAGLVAGALSMAGGEYVSVSSQKDTELAAVGKVKELLDTEPDKAMADLVHDYVTQGFDTELATQIAHTVSDRDAIGAQTQLRYGISAHETTSPWIAAMASFCSFIAGALIPLVAMVCTPAPARVIVTCSAVTVALSVTATVSAWLGDANIPRAIIRNLIVGAATMGITYLVGNLVGIQL